MWWVNKIPLKTKIKKIKKEKRKKTETAVCFDSCLCQLLPLFASDLRIGNETTQ